jgi:excinuclease ABC subunit B
MKRAMDETSRRRQIQLAYNTKFHITPRSIHKRIEETPISVYDRDYYDVSSISEEQVKYFSTKKRIQRMNELEQMMKAAVKNLEFEKAAQYRDELKKIKKWELELGD